MPGAWIGRYLAASLRRANPDFPPDYVLFGEQAGRPDPRRLAVSFLNADETALNDFTLLFLDDFQHVARDAEITHFMEFLLEDLPEQLRLVIASRSVYGLPTTSLFLDQNIAVVSKEMLRFRPEEIRALVKQNHRLELPEA
ncbi:MAG: hypothetical protein HY784_15615 [Chloroflexi bacterium]|nr:hypothetical protein [Chloroflexota bacterium]